ncbi:MAG TPA: division plane positioning ATPase MipZ [Candidatus Sulfotelmatobacter sp.]|nr:division plane positioning ATPase MipZ [Candidatus Sulfotelmatobacter sp.]
MSARTDGAHIIVLGNEKGGSGKSTTAMHVIVGLLHEKRRVGCLDLDVRQGTLSRYVANRIEFCRRGGVRLPMPEQIVLDPPDVAALEPAVRELALRTDVVVIDCPGSDTPLSRRAHAMADTLITPLNDSFIDFDVLARVDAEGVKVVRPSHYAEMVWEQRKQRALERRAPIDWIVMRNRLSALDARNKRDIAHALESLAQRIGFRLAPGFGERVIFRELFLKGLTLLDLREPGTGGGLTMSHVAARQEVRGLLQALRLPVAATPTPATPLVQTALLGTT